MLSIKKMLLKFLRTSMLWRGVASGSLNNYRTSGIYYINTETTSNKPVADATSMWGYLFVMGFTDAMTVQVIWSTANGFYIRSFTGTPGSWGNWVCMTKNNNNVLWTGVHYMTDTQTVNLSEPVSRQASGIVLVWSAYSSGTAQDYDFAYTFVPKWHAVNQGAKGLHCVLCAGFTKKFGDKYVYVSDTQIKGNAGNDDAAVTIANSYTFHSGYWVLRAVIGV